jgi:hypothetical protein
LEHLKKTRFHGGETDPITEKGFCFLRKVSTEEEDRKRILST